MLEVVDDGLQAKRPFGTDEDRRGYFQRSANTPAKARNEAIKRWIELAPAWYMSKRMAPPHIARRVDLRDQEQARAFVEAPVQIFGPRLVSIPVSTMRPK